ncbi:L-serine ammonia-lyase [Parachitinimonas caeni]|uniref:L-serine dehydratase n=1 Tax=Parachitinimonas caeni TaxID=3031301 RepID=A0ABT7DUU5_9NEIS|nr:L-serine ammonia-lyase [Parachitinimonas caeni]MDK2123845.1 L-serine ammonia-lyase [Parachitinimonas caeni]
MAISVFDLFKIGIGPSSSHTVGPMRAAKRFVEGIANKGALAAVRSVKAELFGSLGQTGKGHGSPKAVMLGLLGDEPDTVETDHVPATIARIEQEQRINLLGQHVIAFNPAEDIVLHRRKTLPAHPNGMRFVALDADGSELHVRTYYSVGGGFVVSGDADAETPFMEDQTQVAHPFRSAAELITLTDATGLSISRLMLENEAAWRPEAETRAGLLKIWEVMQSCVKRGCEREGVLPGGLKVTRRAPAVFRKLSTQSAADPLMVMDWINLYALAVNEENAAGGRVVTAPTNGAAGIVPAVLHYYARHTPNPTEEGVVRFLLTAAAIGILYKENASISGAEVGCQGEVGVACSMAAGALAEVMGGTPRQAENAAEIAMEHHLGLTCDPIGGLVQVPCIERNAIGAVKAINSARMALLGDGTHKVSLDKVIKTMRETGADMKSKYKETARGGLAVNIIEC